MTRLSSSPPTLCMIHEAIGGQSAIAKIAWWGVRQALAAGWRVSVVAKFLDESLRDQVEWLPLTVPNRVFLLQWLTARRFITKALGGREFDVVHAHQPQVASLSDVFQCHFLTHVAYERHCLERRPGLKPMIVRAMQQGVLFAEDHYYRNWNPQTRMLFVSEMMRQDFLRLYGPPPKEQVMLFSAPPLDLPTAEQRRQARAKLVGPDYQGYVIGYLGGLQERKGYKRILEALTGERDIFFLMGGQYCDGYQSPALAGHFKALGLVSDIKTFYAACDALIVPSLYEPFGLVASESAARGTPVIATEEVGALPHLLEYGAGMVWKPGTPLAPIVRDVAARRAEFSAGAERMVTDLSEQRQGAHLLDIYESVRQEKITMGGSYQHVA